MSTYSTGQFNHNAGSNIVGKRYGERGIGGTVGEFIQNDSQREIVFNLKAGEPLDIGTLIKELPAGYLIENVYHEVIVAFDGTTPGFTMVVEGNTAITTEVSLATITAMTDTVITGMDTLSSTSAENLIVTVDTAGQEATVGEAVIVVIYRLK